MYIPDAFRVTETSSLFSFIERYDFATIVSTSSAGLIASHVPVHLDRQHPSGVLRAHFARANRHWQAFEGTTEVLTIFQGPHAYVSPSWYKTAPAVPTWNYAAVHVYGKPKVVESSIDAKSLLGALVAKYEHHRKDPWRIDDVPPEFINRLVDAIVTFEIPIARIEGKFKLSQNRSVEDREGTVDGLDRENSQEARSLADFMRMFGVVGAG